MGKLAESMLAALLSLAGSSLSAEPVRAPVTAWVEGGYRNEFVEDDDYKSQQKIAGEVFLPVFSDHVGGSFEVQGRSDMKHSLESIGASLFGSIDDMFVGGGARYETGDRRFNFLEDKNVSSLYGMVVAGSKKDSWLANIGVDLFSGKNAFVEAAALLSLGDVALVASGRSQVAFLKNKIYSDSGAGFGVRASTGMLTIEPSFSISYIKDLYDELHVGNKVSVEIRPWSRLVVAPYVSHECVVAPYFSKFNALNGFEFGVKLGWNFGARSSRYNTRHLIAREE